MYDPSAHWLLTIPSGALGGHLWEVLQPRIHNRVKMLLLGLFLCVSLYFFLL